MAEIRNHKRGRPTTLTPEVHKRIVALIQAGNYAETAAAACGVHKPTLLGWLKEGAIIKERTKGNTAGLSEHRKALVSFSTDVVRAMGEAEARDVMLISKAASGDGKAPGDWKAAAFLLERRNRVRWSQRQEVEVGGSMLTFDGARVAGARKAILDKIARLAALNASRKAVDGDE